jgi:tape measure domain-containing protein
VADIAVLGLRVDASGAIVATQEFGRALNRLGRQGDDTASSLERSGRRLATWLGGAAALRIVQQQADAYTMLRGRLDLVTDGSAELARVEEELFRQAQTNRQAFVATAETYSRLALTAREAGISTDVLLQASDAISKSLLLSGTSAASANAALVQFSQGISAGVLRGEELNSVLEQAPRLAMAVAQGLNVPTAALRKLGEAGLLTSERVLGALQSQLPKLAEEAATVPRTIGQSLTLMNNAFGRVLSTTDRTTSATAVLSGAIATGAEWLVKYADAAAAVGVALGAGGLVLAARMAYTALMRLAAAQTIASFLSLAAGVRSLADAMALAQLAAGGLWRAIMGPFGAVLAAVTAIGGAFYLWRRNAKGAADESKAAMEAAKPTTKPFDDLSDEFAKIRTRATAGAGSGRNATQDAADRVRLAQQQLDLVRQTADAAALQEIRDRAVNDAIAARRELRGRDLRVALDGIAAEQRLALAAETARQARAASQGGEDRVRAARQAYEAVGLEVDALERLRIEQAAVNALVLARRELSGENLAIVERSIEAERQLAVAGLEAAGIRNRTQARAEQQASIDGMVREMELLQAQAEALKVSRNAYEQLRIEQAAGAAVLEARNAAKARGITLSDEDAQRIEGLARAAARARGEVDGLLNSGTASFTEGLRDALGLVQGIAVGFGEGGRALSTVVAGVSQLVQGLDRAQKAAAASKAGGAASGMDALLQGASVIGPLIGLSVSIFQQGRAALARERAEIEAEVTRFEQAMTRFREAIGSLSGSVVDQLAAITKAETEALAAARQREEELQRRNNVRINLTGTIPEDAQRARVGVGTRFLEELSRQLVGAFATSLEREIMELDRAQADRAATLNALLAADAISQEAYNAAMQTSIAIRDRLAAQLQEEDARRVRIADEQRRRAIEDDRFRALDGLMPRRELDDLRFAAEQARELFDLIASGADDAAVAARRLALAAEAARREAERAEGDRRTRDSLISRIYGGMGNAQAADDEAFRARQREELADAVREGMSDANLVLLRFAQQVERAQRAMERAIAEQTATVEREYERVAAAVDAQADAVRASTARQLAAIDEQITAIDAAAEAADRVAQAQLDALETQLDVQRDALAAAESSLRVNQASLDALRGFADSLTFSADAALSPTDQLAAARAEYERVLQLAQMGNADAAGQLPDVARRFLELSRAVNASGPQYARDFAAVREAVAQVAQVFGAAVDRDTGTVQALTTQIARTEEQIRVLTASREQARADAEAQITALREMRDRVQAASDAQLAALEQQKAEARANADRQIEVIRAVEEAIFRSAVEASEYYAAWRAASAGLDELTRTASERATDYYDHVYDRDREPINVVVPPDPRVDAALIEQRGTNERLEQAIAVIADGLTLVADRQAATTTDSQQTRAAIRQGFETLSAALAALAR